MSSIPPSVPNDELTVPDLSHLPSHTRVDFRARTSRYLVIIPVLNEGKRIVNQLDRMRAWSHDWDVMVVDGGSTDGATSEAGLRESGVRTLVRKTGPGKLGTQLRLGLGLAMRDGYAGVVLMDGNNKDNPDDLAKFFRGLDEGWDHLQGSRFIAGGRHFFNPWLRLALIRLLHAPLISMAAGFAYTDTTNGFRAYSRRFLGDRTLAAFRTVFTGYEYHYYLAVQAGQLGFHIRELGVERRYPRGEKVPTKIRGLRGYQVVWRALWDVISGKFDPETEWKGATA